MCWALSPNSIKNRVNFRDRFARLQPVPVSTTQGGDTLWVVGLVRLDPEMLEIS